MNTVVYTCVMGDFDYVGEHEFLPGVDYLYYTDQKTAPEGWKRREFPFKASYDNRRLAKIPKCAPHLISELNMYDHTIWIDGDMEILRDTFPLEILGYLPISDRGMVVSPHFDGRNCAYGESEIRPPKYANEPIDEQVAAYEKEGFPKEFGLYEGGVIVRAMGDEKVEEVGNLWLLQNLLYSYQDQISLPYVFWKLDYKPTVLPQSFRNFEWLRVNAHKSED